MLVRHAFRTSLRHVLILSAAAAAVAAFLLPSPVVQRDNMIYVAAAVPHVTRAPAHSGRTFPSLFIAYIAIVIVIVHLLLNI